MSPAAVAINRFGLGARPDEAAPADPKHWLARQIDAYDPRPKLIANLPDSMTLGTEIAVTTRRARQIGSDEAKDTMLADLRKQMRDVYKAAAEARILQSVATDTPFAERLVHFWSNHFAISADKTPVTPFAGAFEAEAIRPHVMGRFEDMLLAVTQHAGMILFLDQTRSIGPTSVQAERRYRNKGVRDVGLNENLAREIMELHTLGVRSGYSQNDVTEFARALTGWSINVAYENDAIANRPHAAFVFRPAVHEPGARTILGKRYDQAGEAQARAVLHDLAIAPATARHVATKLARHFAGDEPPTSLVAKLTAAFETSGGDLPSVYRALIEAPESWSAQPSKFKSPWEWAISLWRGTGRRSFEKFQGTGAIGELGQPIWTPGSPAGWDDLASKWAAPDALVRRVEAAAKLALRYPNKYDPRDLAPKLLLGEPSTATRQAIANADTRLNGLVLLLVSPEFQRR